LTGPGLGTTLSADPSLARAHARLPGAAVSAKTRLTEDSSPVENGPRRAGVRAGTLTTVRPVR